jgi:hypothetical protein
MTRAELATLELQLLANTVDLAVRRAVKGFPHHGYLELLCGLERARTAPPGDLWKADLEQRWEQALRNYARFWLPAN